jgi:hypothetical protein
MALISLIAGILGLTFVPFIGSIVAVITGPMAKREILESQGALGGEGLATAGIVLGWIGIGLGVLSICGVGLFIAVPACLVLFGITTQGTGMLLPALLAFLF